MAQTFQLVNMKFRNECLARLIIGTSVAVGAAVGGAGCTPQGAQYRLADVDTLIAKAQSTPGARASRPLLEEAAKELKSIIRSSQGKDRYKALLRLAELDGISAGEREKALNDADAFAQASFGPDSLEHAELCVRKGRFYFSEKALADSANAWIEAKRIFETQKEPIKKRKMECIAGQIAAECANGKCIDAENLFKELLELRRKYLGESAPATLTSMNLLAEVYWKKKKYEQAKDCYLAVYERSRNMALPAKISGSLNLARSYIITGDYQEAKPLLDETLALSQPNSKSPFANGSLVPALQAYVDYYERQNNKVEAEKFSERLAQATKSRQ